MSCITTLQATQSDAGKQRVREQHEAWAHDQGYGAWWQRWADAVGTDESHMEQQFDSEMEALRGAVNRQATNQGGMREAQRAELQQLTNLRQTEVLQQRKQHQAEFQRRQQQRLASAEHACDQDENNNPASAMKSSDGAGVEAEAAESEDATGTESNINNQGNKRAADESDDVQQPSAQKKQRRNKRDRGSHMVRQNRKRVRERSAHEVQSE